MGLWVWGFYVLALAWGAALCGWVGGFLAQEDRRAFLELRKTLLSHSALALTDALTDKDSARAEIFVRRLAGEKESRYAALVDQRGGVVFSVGSRPDKDMDASLSQEALASRSLHILEIPASPPFLEMAEPLWTPSRKWGVLRLGVWTDGLEQKRRQNRFRLGLTWLWGAVAGGVVTFIYWNKGIKRSSFRHGSSRNPVVESYSKKNQRLDSG